MLAGPLASFALKRAEPPAGGAMPTIALSPSVIDTLVAVTAVLLASCLCAFAAARVSRAGVGLLAGGLVVVWADLQSANLDQLLTAVRDGSVLISLAIEGAIVLAVGLAIVLASYRGAGDPIATLGVRKAGKPVSVPGLVTGLVGAATLATLLAANPLKLQCIVAATAAGAAAGVAVRLSMPDWAAGPGVLILGVLAILAPLAGWSMVADPVGGHTASDMIPIAKIMPLDWLAGALIGVPIGRFWTAGTMEAQRQNGIETDADGSHTPETTEPTGS